MTLNDGKLRALLNSLEPTAMPKDLAARLNDLSRKPQVTGWRAVVARLIPLDMDDLGFGLRHDLRYQAAALGLTLTLSLGIWHGVQTLPSNATMASFSDEAALILEADPVISGAL